MCIEGIQQHHFAYKPASICIKNLMAAPLGITSCAEALGITISCELVN